MDTKDKRLEKIAEELMGSRKWKQYQDSVEKNYSSEYQQSGKSESDCIKNKNTEGEIKSSENLERMTVGGGNCEKLDQKEISNQNDDNNKVSPEVATTPEPVDWQPQQDKCYFCVDGKIVKLNETGEIAEQSESELNKHIIESDDSSQSFDSPHIHQPTKQSKLSASQPNFIPKQLEFLLKNIIPDTKMTSLESMAAAQLAAFQRLQAVPDLNQLNPLYTNLLLQQLQQHMSPSPTPERTSSPSANKSIGTVDLPESSPINLGTSGSGEQPLDLSAKPCGSTSLLMDPKNIFKAKPRISVPNRRAYTEEELNNALQDILSGKLGTRRAAVLYGIPRSTLRNKVYKLAIEQKRELLANNPPIAVLEGDDDDKDSDQEDDRYKSSNLPLQNYWKMMEGSVHMNNDQNKSSSSSSSWPMDAAAMLQNLLLANSGNMSGFSHLTQAPTPTKEDFPEFLRHLLTQSQELKSPNESASEKNERNGSPNNIDRLSMLNLLQQQFSKVASTPTTPGLDSDANEDSSILKVPSVKSSILGSGVTTPSSSGGHSRNGDVHSVSPSISPQIGASPGSGQHTPILANHINMLSHNLRRDSPSPPPHHSKKFNLREVIQESINKNFRASALAEDIHKHSTPLTIDPMDHYNKRPTISVIKNLGGTDISRFGTNPNVTQINPSQLSPNNTGTGGKGTRPKRGKYRNYDRDSLVEAVKAVQRGEMSVHRAGSYYGVPHSTLEYKVKERHLMRPRKREPKPQPGLESTSKSDIPGIRVAEKSKPAPGASQKPMMKANFQGTNGIKIPPFLDPSMAAQLQYTSQLFWNNPTNFPIAGLEFARQAAAQGNSGPFPPNSAESIFTQQMLQKIHEEQQQQQLKNSMNGKSHATDRTEFEDAPPTNGGSTSFLDGIIRQSLDKSKPNDVHSTLFEQLFKSTKRSLASTSFENNDFLASMAAKKMTENPLDLLAQHHSEMIKKERTSPLPDKLMKMNDGMMSPRYENSREDLNGSVKCEPSDDKSSSDS